MTIKKEDAMQVWQQAKKDFYNPPLADPVFDEPNILSFQSTAAIEISSPHYTLHVNLKAIPGWLEYNQRKEFLRNILGHEIVHYTYIPYDEATVRKLLHNVIKGLKEGGVDNQDAASVVFNMTSDWINDTYRLKTCGFKDLVIPQTKNAIKDVQMKIHGRDSNLFKRFLRMFKEYEKPSQIWQVLAREYEILWDVNLGIIGYDSSLEKYTRPIANILQDYHIKSSWPKKFHDIAVILSPLFNELVKEQKRNLGKKEKMEGTEKISLQLPPDLMKQMGRNPKTIDYKEKYSGGNEKKGLNSDDSASQLSYKDFEKLVEIMEGEDKKAKSEEENYIRQYKLGRYNLQKRGCSCGYGKLEIKKRWHRERGYNLVRIQEVIAPIGTETPLTPKTWVMSDPFNELDVQASVFGSGSPKLIPGITTKKWEKCGEYGSSLTNIVPDLLIALDSSGSMSGEIEGSPFDIALDGAHGALYYAASKGARTAGINFSDVPIIQDWTNDRNDVETILNLYQGGGTTFPVNEIYSLIKKNPQPTITLAVTDTHIFNLDETIRTLKEILSDKKNQVVIFAIGGCYNKEEFEEIGCEIHDIKDTKELANKLIGKTIQVYKMW